MTSPRSTAVSVPLHSVLRARFERARVSHDVDDPIAMIELSVTAYTHGGGVRRLAVATPYRPDRSIAEHARFALISALHGEFPSRPSQRQELVQLALSGAPSAAGAITPFTPRQFRGPPTVTWHHFAFGDGLDGARVLQVHDDHFDWRFECGTLTGTVPASCVERGSISIDHLQGDIGGDRFIDNSVRASAIDEIDADCVVGDFAVGAVELCHRSVHTSCISEVDARRVKLPVSFANACSPSSALRADACAGRVSLRAVPVGSITLAVPTMRGQSDTGFDLDTARGVIGPNELPDKCVGTAQFKHVDTTLTRVRGTLDGNLIAHGSLESEHFKDRIDAGSVRGDLANARSCDTPRAHVHASARAHSAYVTDLVSCDRAIATRMSSKSARTRRVVVSGDRSCVRSTLHASRLSSARWCVGTLHGVNGSVAESTSDCIHASAWNTERLACERAVHAGTLCASSITSRGDMACQRVEASSMAVSGLTIRHAMSASQQTRGDLVCAQRVRAKHMAIRGCTAGGLRVRGDLRMPQMSTSDAMSVHSSCTARGAKSHRVSTDRFECDSAALGDLRTARLSCEGRTFCTGASEAHGAITGSVVHCTRLEAVRDLRAGPTKASRGLSTRSVAVSGIGSIVCGRSSTVAARNLACDAAESGRVTVDSVRVASQLTARKPGAEIQARHVRAGTIQAEDMHCLRRVRADRTFGASLQTTASNCDSAMCEDAVVETCAGRGSTVRVHGQVNVVQARCEAHVRAPRVRANTVLVTSASHSLIDRMRAVESALERMGA